MGIIVALLAGICLRRAKKYHKNKMREEKEEADAVVRTNILHSRFAKK